MFFLERRFPLEFSLGPVPPRRDPEADKELEEEIPSEILTKHKPLYLQMIEEDRQKQAVANTKQTSYFV
jgi:hypothetical protein